MAVYASAEVGRSEQALLSSLSQPLVSLVRSFSSHGDLNPFRPNVLCYLATIGFEPPLIFMHTVQRSFNKLCARRRERLGTRLAPPPPPPLPWYYNADFYIFIVDSHGNFYCNHQLFYSNSELFYIFSCSYFLAKSTRSYQISPHGSTIQC